MLAVVLGIHQILDTVLVMDFPQRARHVILVQVSASGIGCVPAAAVHLGVRCHIGTYRLHRGKTAVGREQGKGQLVTGLCHGCLGLIGIQFLHITVATGGDEE